MKNMPIDDALAQIRKTDNNLEAKTETEKPSEKELVLNYKPVELLSEIDDELNLYIRRNESFNIKRIIDSYNMEDKYKPIIKEYIAEVGNIHAKVNKEYVNDMKKINSNLRLLGYISSPMIGAGIGAIIGYLTDSQIMWAFPGASGGFVAELFFYPSARLIAKKVLDSKANSMWELFNESQQIARNKTLRKLQNL